MSQDILPEGVRGYAQADRQIFGVVVGTAPQQQLRHLIHMAVLRLLQSGTLDPQIESTHGLTAPDLHIEFPVGRALHRPAGGIA